jgi:hypothetical protein
MLTLKWERPVRAAGQLIAGPLEAHQFLMHGWPHRKNEDWSAAENTALAALDGRKSPDEAREKFKAAVMSAKLN